MSSDILSFALPDVQLSPQELLESAWFQIKDDPDSYCQRAWRRAQGPGPVNKCGTAFCFAGWAVELNGDAKWVSDDPLKKGFQVLAPVKDDPGTDVLLYNRLFANGELPFLGVRPQDRAQRLLNISKADADYIFDAARSLDEIRMRIESLLGRPVSGRNPKLLRQVMAYIEQNPSDWKQGLWWAPRKDSDGHTCGSSGCFAGWAVALSGGKYAPGIEAVIADEKDDWTFSRNMQDLDGEWRHVSLTSVSGRAARVLGLTGDDDDILFDGSNTLQDLRRYVDNLCAGRDINDHSVDSAVYALEGRST